MNASRTDHPRTRPVALRTKSDCSPGCPAPAATVAIPDYLLELRISAACQNELLDLLLAVDVDHGTEQLALLVRAAGVDAQGLPEPRCAARLVDVAVQRQRRLVLLDRLAYSGGPHRHG